jgi:hypothetical protein
MKAIKTEKHCSTSVGMIVEITIQCQKNVVEHEAGGQR